MKIDGQLESKLKELRLTGMLQTLPIRIKQAEESNSGYQDFLMTLIEDEYERRQSGRLLKRLRQAGFEEEKTLEGFDFSFNPQIPVKKIKQLANCLYIENKENIFLLGPVGVGKSHIAQALGHIACRMGYDVLYTKATKMFRYLNGGRADNSWEIRIKRHTVTDLLIIDDFGLTHLEQQQQLDLMEIVEDRHGRASTIIASQLPVSNWYDVIPEETIADAILDRLVHVSYRIELKGESLRKKR